MPVDPLPFGPQYTRRGKTRQNQLSRRAEPARRAFSADVTGCALFPPGGSFLRRHLCGADVVLDLELCRARHVSETKTSGAAINARRARMLSQPALWCSRTRLSSTIRTCHILERHSGPHAHTELRLGSEALVALFDSSPLLDFGSDVARVFRAGFARGK